MMQLASAIMPVYSAQMQNTNWDDLRYIIALHRSESFSAAARLLGVNSTTVARRLAALELKMGQVVARKNRVSHTLTDNGLQLLQIALHTQEAMRNLQERAADATQQVAGEISITGTPAVCNRLLMPRLRDFCNDYPKINVQLLPDNNNLDIDKHDIDIALRLGRPEQGGHQFKVRRIGLMSHAVYASSKTKKASLSTGAWIGYSSQLQHLAHVQWIEAEILQNNHSRSPLKVLDLDGAVEAIAQGLGQSVIPCLIGDADKRLKRVDCESSLRHLQREVWVMCRADRLHLARVRATLDWLKSVFKS